MSQCACYTNAEDMHSYRPGNHTNAFINLNGMPYLMSEYIDREIIQQLDPSMVYSSIDVDQSEAMRVIIDVNVDDIGRKDSGLNVIGNTTQIKNLYRSITNNKARLHSKLPVLRKGLVIRCYYRLENAKTGIVLRTAIETLRISERNLFVLINSQDLNDNAIIDNFCSSMVSTINEFTHGTEPMILRVTHIQFAYEYVKVNPVIPRITQSIVGYPTELLNSCEYPDPYAAHPVCNMSEADMYNYHKDMQTHHRIGDPYYGKPNNYVVPDSWYAFSRFYHFSEGGSDIILHENEIYDKATKAIEMQCGTIQVNRAFIVNPGHRIVWKFCIWKNDLILVNDTTRICQILQAPWGSPFPFPGDDVPECPYHPQPKPQPCPRPKQDPSRTDYTQNEYINTLMDMLHDLRVELNEITGDDTPVPEPEHLPVHPTPHPHPHPYPPIPPRPPFPPHPPYPPQPGDIDKIKYMIGLIERQIDVLEEKQKHDDERPDIDEITDAEIEAAVRAADEATTPVYVP